MIHMKSRLSVSLKNTKTRHIICKAHINGVAAQLLIDYGFNNLNLHKIWMELYEFDNLKIDFFSEEFDFKQDGLLRDNGFENGKYWDSYIISLIKKK